MNLNQMAKEDIKEMSLIELTHAILGERKQAISFQELISEIASLQDLKKEQLQQKLPQFYTDLNVDGRFNITGEQMWGLKDWYPIDQVEDEMVNPVKPKKKKAKKVEEEEFDEVEEDLDDYEEEDLDADLDEDSDDDLIDLDEDEDDDDIEEDLVDDDFELEDEDEEEEEEDL
ncbi:DNA-directed RNA polymerase subunit delta [Bacillus sp. 1P06AnD]|uniref:DNA-directed RNA polymerase subunit delta n=1 Tax=Bacillus sp. 1P06AnD TaxID=3132208 RepID=UPI0039A361E5